MITVRGVVTRRSVVLGAASGLLLSVVFVVVVGWLGGRDHLIRQVRADWWLFAPLALGFAIQVALMVELRRRHRLAAAASSASIGGSAGVSGVGMLACCAHHVADLVPLAGATGMATFLTGVQRPAMVAGLLVNGVAIAIALRRLGRVRPLPVVPAGGPSPEVRVEATCPR